jgi:hypothetical protein
MVAAFVFDLAAAVTPPQVQVGWTPAATMGAVQALLTAVGGGTALKILANHLLSLRKIAAERATAVDARGDAQNVALTARVTDLERQQAEREKAWTDERRELDKLLSDERRDCDRQLAEMRGELREMQTKIDGFVRQIVAFQTSEARAMPLSPQMTRAMQTLDEVKGAKE